MVNGLERGTPSEPDTVVVPPVAEPSDDGTLPVDLKPWQQLYDSDGTNNVRRQSRGAMSWSLLVNPIIVNAQDPAQKFRAHIMVFKDRDLTAEFPTARVSNDNTGVGFGGGTVKLDAPVQTMNGTNADVRKDDWILMINSNGTSQQIGFYRVLGYYYDPNRPDDIQVTLDGPDFDFSVGQTELVHLVGLSATGLRSGRVINVFERTMRWEGKSNWN